MSGLGRIQHKRTDPVGPDYQESEYRGVHIAAYRRYGTWHPYINKRLIQNIGFDAYDNAFRWIRKTIDNELGKTRIS